MLEELLVAISLTGLTQQVLASSAGDDVVDFSFEASFATTVGDSLVPRLVQEEIGRLEDGADVYKLIGPVLMSQDLEEARQNVDKRIEFIRGEM